MTILSKRTAKKGDRIIIVSPWNFHYNDENKRNSVDEYNVSTWVIHSIGNKILKIMDEKGMRGEQFRANDKGEFCLNWNTGVSKVVFREDDVEECMMAQINTDPTARANYKLVYNQYC